MRHPDGGRPLRPKKGRRSSAAGSPSDSTDHQISCALPVPAHRQDARVGRWRSGLATPRKDANTTPHSAASAGGGSRTPACLQVCGHARTDIGVRPHQSLSFVLHSRRRAVAASPRGARDRAFRWTAVGVPWSCRHSTGSVDGAAARRAGAVELVGEPGIGKTRLLAELGGRTNTRGCWCCRAARGSSSATCRSGCSSTRSTSTSPGCRPGTARRLLGAPDIRGQLGSLFPSRFSQRRPPAAGRTSAAGPRRAVRRCLEVLAARTPLVLLLDDVRSADRGSVGAARGPAAPAPAAPVLLAAGDVAAAGARAAGRERSSGPGRPAWSWRR